VRVRVRVVFAGRWALGAGCWLAPASRKAQGTKQQAPKAPVARTSTKHQVTKTKTACWVLTGIGHLGMRLRARRQWLSGVSGSS
jgi:hypothetical protein